MSQREKNPSLSADELIEDAKSGGRIVQLVVTLSTEIRVALDDFAEHQGTNSDDAAGNLIREGLYLNDFLAADQI